MIEAGNSELSEREREILRLVATGASNKEIAQELHISPNTVKVHLRNIFAKIGSSSRTEATLYAIRTGLVHVPATAAAREASGDSGPGTTQEQRNPADALQAAVRPRPRRRQRLVVGLVILLIVGVTTAALAVLSFSNQRPPAVPSPVPTPTVLPQWRTLPDMPTARSELAVAVYENQIYAIAGQALGGPTGAVERYDPKTQEWDTLASKPLAVADVQSAVIGGRLYVPGGRLADGTVTNRLEAYDPRRNIWEQRQSTPVAVSAYALATFEGKLYLFGGWDGQQFVDTVYEYDPETDAWAQRTSMSTARGFMGAASIEGSIYVIGGRKGIDALNLNEAYTPINDLNGENPWRLRAEMPSKQSSTNVTTLGDVIFTSGKVGASPSSELYAYLPQTDQWQLSATLGDDSMPGRLIGLTGQLHFLGGLRGSTPTAEQLSYQPLYTVLLPIITR